MNPSRRNHRVVPGGTSAQARTLTSQVRDPRLYDWRLGKQAQDGHPHHASAAAACSSSGGGGGSGGGGSGGGGSSMGQAVAPPVLRGIEHAKSWSGGTFAIAGAIGSPRANPRNSNTGGQRGGPEGAPRTEQEAVDMAKAAMVRHPGPPLPAACIVGARSSFIDMGQDARPPQLVSPCICIGSKEDAADAEWLRELGVTHVLNVAREAPLAHPAQFFCLKVDLLDNADQTLRPFRDQTAAFMRNVEGIGGRVLVHCVAGCSRSVSVVITHLMVSHGLCLRTALAHIRRHRSLAYPNQAFLYELAVMETEIFKASSVNRGVIAEFNFYKWNKIKRQYRHHCPEYDSSGCCSVQ